MPNREKVIKGIECCEIKGDCTGCPYDVEQGLPACKQLAIDALELLKEQDSVEYALDVLRRNGWKDDSYGDLLKEQETEFVYDKYYAPVCKECGFHPFTEYIPPIRWMQVRGYKACPGCGRKVKWNES